MPKAKAKQLTPEAYQRYKKAWNAIDLDFDTDMREMSYPKIFGDAKQWYTDQMQTEARFREARRRALRTQFGLPRKVDYDPGAKFR